MSLAVKIDSPSLKYHYLTPVLAKLPQRIAYRLASLNGRLQFSRHAEEAEMIVRQMQQVFFNKKPAELKGLARYFYCMVEREALDTRFFQKLKTPQQVAEFITLKGFDQVLAARKVGKRVIITSGHFGRFWMAGVGMKAQGISVGTITRDGGENNQHGLPEAEYQYRMEKLRRLQEYFTGPFLIEGDSTRPLYRALDEHVMAIFVDVPYEQEKLGCIELPFLGRTGLFPLGAAKIAIRTKALIVPFYVYESRQGLQARFFQGIEAENMQAEEIMRHLVQLLEAQILQHPEQWWLWQALPFITCD